MIQPLGVGQNALFGFEFVVLAGLGPDGLDLFELEIPEIDQPQFVLLIVLQLGNPLRDLVPSLHRPGPPAQIRARGSVQQREPRRRIEGSTDWFCA